MPNTPLKLAGMRIDPPPSLPVAMVHSPAANAAPAPPLEPPGVRAVSHGLRQGAPNSFSVVPDCPNSGVLVLPSTMAPAALTRSTTIESAAAAHPRNTADPSVVGKSAVASKSLIDTGIPCSGPKAQPRATASSAARASASAPSGRSAK